MFFPIFKLNPLAQKRIRHFIRHKRASLSLLILLIIYLASLASELICNDKPIMLHCNGKFYFPFAAFHSEDHFLHNEIHTAPDYKKLAQNTAFQNAGGWMIWAPIPYGPNETISEESLEESLRMHCRMEPLQETAVIIINPDLSIRKVQNLKDFDSETQTTSITLDKLWQISPAIRTAISARFNNIDAQAVSETAEGIGAFSKAELSLPEYKQRRKAPKNLRITIRPVAQKEQPVDFYLTVNAGIPYSNSPTFSNLPPILQSELTTICNEIKGTNNNIARQCSFNDATWQISLEKECLRFPFRPNAHHIFGLDDAGRDLFVRLLYAIRTSITFGLALVICSLSLGTLIGLFQGYFGSWIDLGCQRLIEIWSALPFLYIIILLGSIYGQGFMLMLFCYALFNWIGISYYMRAEMLRLKHQPFVEAAKCLGIPDRRIIVRHILPNAMVPLVTFFPFSLVGAIGALAALDYLGFGLPPQSPSIGQLLQQAQNQRWAWWLTLYPSLVLFILMLLGVFIGEGVRDALDPKAK